MSFRADWPHAELIETARLRLEPLRVEHAEEMASVLDDQSLHEYTGGHPETLEQLRARYARQVAGQSADGTQGWLNWIICHRETEAVLGTVQATLYEAAGGGTSAEIAWVIASARQRQGYAKQNTGQVIVSVPGTGEVLTLKNHSSSSAVGLASDIGGTQANVASITIEKLG